MRGFTGKFFHRIWLSLVEFTRVYLSLVELVRVGLPGFDGHSVVLNMKGPSSYERVKDQASL